MIEPMIPFEDSETGEIIYVPNKEFNPLDNNPELYEKRLKASGIPSEYWNLDYEDYVGTESLDDLKKAIYYENHFDEDKFRGKGLYIYGPNRTQKTTVMCAIGKKLLRRNKKIIYLQAGDLQNLLLNEINFNPDPDKHKIVSKMKSGYYDLIMIDDLFSPVKQFMWKDGKGDYIVASWDGFFRSAFQSKLNITLTSNTRLDDVGNMFSKDIQEMLLDYMHELIFIDSSKVTKREWKDKVWE